MSAEVSAKAPSRAVQLAHGTAEFLRAVRSELVQGDLAHRGMS